LARPRIVKWNDSLAIRIPKAVAEELRLRAGDWVVVDASDGRIELRRAAPTLKELVAWIRPENRQGETD
jgi:antitoxin MazE